MNYQTVFENIGLKVPNILLPNKNVDFSKFAVVAVDQYTENDEYWNKVCEIVGDKASTLNMVLPENFFLHGDNDYNKRINIVKQYLNNQTLVDIGKSFIFVKRKLEKGIRCGLVAAFDLEQYDYNIGGTNLIKVTEKTDLSRVIPRVALREKIDIELPHIFMLVSDKKNQLMNYLNNSINSFEKVYDFDLMQNGGSIEGYKIQSAETFDEIAKILNDIFEANDKKFSFAIGDGNHSFAAAKMHYENLKKVLPKDVAKNHPARYCLAEIINLYDDSMDYEPIHRMLFNVEDKQKSLIEFSHLLSDDLTSFDEVTKKYDIQILQPVIDKWLLDNPNVKIEYIHSKKECEEKKSDPHVIALTFDKFDKDVLVKTILDNKVLVRKSFSMGRANEKRYYLEARKIV